MAQTQKDAFDIAGLNKTILDNQTQLKKSNDALTALTTKHTELTSAKAAVDKQVESLTVQGKKDTSEIAVLKKRIAELEALLKQANGRNDLLYTRVYALTYCALTYTTSPVRLTYTPPRVVSSRTLTNSCSHTSSHKLSYFFIHLRFMVSNISS